MRFFGLVALISVRLLGQQQESLTQEGGYWVHTMTNSSGIPLHGTLVVSSRGSVIVKGNNRPAISFRLTQRVRAHSEAEARQLFGPVGLSNATSGGFTRFDVVPTSSPSVSTQLELNVPRQLSSVIVQTQGEG